MSDKGKQIEKWADDFMFASEKHNASEGPKVHLLAAGNDPLGQIAACAKMYMGEVVRDLADVTDEERRHYAVEMQKTKLKMPLEAVSLHFMLENVTRAFTHQLVRQRTAAYAQESMRFAVVEDMTQAVALPPSLAKYNDPEVAHSVLVAEAQRLPLSDSEQAYLTWISVVQDISTGYMDLVNKGMPAEDARGLMPTNIITRVNYITNLRGLLDHAGNRLCTQAQFEWRMVFAHIANALRAYGREQTYLTREGGITVGQSSAWQFEVLADLLKPVCYQTGSCAFKADFDRKCSIRGRVDANAEMGRPSSEWDKDLPNTGLNVDAYNDDKDPEHVGRDKETHRPVFIGAIHPREWLADPAAAR